MAEDSDPRGGAEGPAVEGHGSSAHAQGWGCLFAAGLIWTLCCGLCTSCTVIGEIGAKPPYLYSGPPMQGAALVIGLPSMAVGLLLMWLGRRKRRR